MGGGKRVKELGESLRDEIIAGEEQRAYIDMLKAVMDKQIKEMGLNFCGPSSNKRQTDCYLEYLQLQRANT